MADLTQAQLLRHSVTPAQITYISILFPAKRWQPPCRLTSSSCAVRLSPFPGIFPHSLLTHRPTNHLSHPQPRTLSTDCARKPNRPSSPMAVLITDPDAYPGEMSAFDNDDDDDDQYSDTSSTLTEISPSEFPTYFVERDSRLFPSHGDPSYPFPVDGHEHNVRVFRLSPSPPLPRLFQLSLTNVLIRFLRTTLPYIGWRAYSE